MTDGGNKNVTYACILTSKVVTKDKNKCRKFTVIYCKLFVFIIQLA
jgi:hypothetical protein